MTRRQKGVKRIGAVIAGLIHRLRESGPPMDGTFKGAVFEKGRRAEPAGLVLTL